VLASTGARPDLMGGARLMARVVEAGAKTR